MVVIVERVLDHSFFFLFVMLCLADHVLTVMIGAETHSQLHHCLLRILFHVNFIA